MKKIILGLPLAALLLANLFSQSATAPAGNANFSWWRAIDVEEGLNKTEMFDAYLGDLVSVGKIGYKALPPEALDPRNKEKIDQLPAYYLAQGTIINTDSLTDFAISGQGFFKVSNDDGSIFYTRTGNFVPDRQGILRNEEGLKLEPALVIERDSRDLFIDDEGVLWQAIDKTRDAKELYTFELWLPSPEAKVEREGLHFSFSDVIPVTINRQNRLLIKSLELSTSEGIKTIAQMTQLLYDLRSEESNEESLDFRLYMVDFLLKEYSKAQGSFTDLERFSRLAAGIAGSVAFAKDNS